MEQDLAAEVAVLRAEVDTLARAVHALLDQREEVRPAGAAGDASAARRPTLAQRARRTLGGLWQRAAAYDWPGRAPEERVRLALGGLIVVGLLVGYEFGLLQPRPAPQRVPVVFPTQEIAQGTLIQPHHLQTAALERWLVPPGRILAPQQAIGRRASTSLRRGQVVLEADVSPAPARRDP